jgi:accessory gene regulator protein AgrB
LLYPNISRAKILAGKSEKCTCAIHGCDDSFVVGNDERVIDIFESANYVEFFEFGIRIMLDGVDPFVVIISVLNVRKVILEELITLARRRIGCLSFGLKRPKLNGLFVRASALCKTHSLNTIFLTLLFGF